MVIRAATRNRLTSRGLVLHSSTQALHIHPEAKVLEAAMLPRTDFDQVVFEPGSTVRALKEEMFSGRSSSINLYSILC
jgi:hypothetical protein